MFQLLPNLSIYFKEETPILRNTSTFTLQWHAFNCLGYIKKYADSGTRTNIVCFPRLLLARVQLPGLRLLTVRTELSGRLIHP